MELDTLFRKSELICPSGQFVAAGLLSVLFPATNAKRLHKGNEGPRQMLCHLYIHDGTAYVPTAAKTEAGYYLDVEPVEVVPILEEDGFKAAIRRSIGRGHPIVPTPTRATGFPKPVVLAHAKARSLKAFEKNASYWALCEQDDRYRIEQWKRRDEGGWLPDPTHDEVLPPGASIDEAINQLFWSVQSGHIDPK